MSSVQIDSMTNTTGGYNTTSTAVPGALDTALQSEDSIQSCDTLPPPTPV